MSAQAGFLDLIRLAVENRAGRKIVSMSDARWLAEELEKQKLFLSAHTIARFFRIIKPERKIYRESLNVLAIYSGFIDWNHFCQATDHVLPVSALAENRSSSDWLAQVRLEIALQNQEWEKAVNILESFAELPLSGRFLASLITVLVESIRKWKAPAGLMKALGDSATGRRFYYEHAVDEDDHEGYFSESLRRYYKPPEGDSAKWFFRESYLYSREFYRGGNPGQTPSRRLSSDQLPELHFHEQSRWFEMAVIDSHYEGGLGKKFGQILENAIRLMKNTEADGKAWLPARIIMAAFHLGKGNLILQNTDALKTIRAYVLSADFSLRHNADHLLQFVYCLAIKSGFLPDEPYQPMRQRQDFFWNQNQRVALEYATGLCFQPKHEEAESFAEFTSFCMKYSLQWILNALQFRKSCV